MKSEIIESLRQRIAEVGLASHTEAILATARPAVDIYLAGASQGAIGESRFGGAPDLPSTMPWPRNEDGKAYVFLLQINLNELPEFEAKPFPSQGMIYVFLGADEPANDVDHRLMLWQVGEALQPAAMPEPSECVEADFLDLPPHRLRFELRADTPHWATSDAYDLLRQMEMEDDEEAESVYELGKSGDESRVGQLLGHVSGIGQDPREDAFVIREVNADWIYNYSERRKLDMAPAKLWLNLLRIDSITELNFTIWDAGYLNFLIRDSDLASLNFENVYAEVESS